MSTDPPAPAGGIGPGLRALARGSLADRLFLAFLAAYLGFGLVAAVWLTRSAWSVHRLTRGVGDTVFLDASGRRWFTLDEHRDDVPLSDISPHLQHAIVAVEDHRFRLHPGIDPVGFLRASWRNLREMRVVEGGSTITQQLARTLFLTNNRTVGRKGKEAVLAVLLEQQLRKDQILELYLNRVYLGSGTYGVEAMSKLLFGKRARSLGLAEAALVAGLVRAPTALSPWTNLDGALARSHVVLDRMRAEGYIGAEEEKAARKAALRLQPRPRSEASRHGYAKDYLRQQFRERFGGDHPPDWEVETTFLPALQDAAEAAVARGLRRLDRKGLQAALVALRPQTGEILALVGGADSREAPFNRAVRSRRQPGSAFKPFVYAAALERGFAPTSVLTRLSEVSVPGPREWSPRQGRGGADELTLRQALYESDNAAAVALQQRIGSRSVLKLADAVGLHDLPDVPSLALGTGSVSPLELTSAFGVFPSSGLVSRPHGIREVREADATVAWVFEEVPARVLREETAFQALSLLVDVVERGTASSARSLGVSFPAGGKTGTTDEYRDAWFVGFSSEVVAGVWVGFDQPASLGEGAYAARVALPVWCDFMKRAASAYRPRAFRVPAGLEPVELCRESFLLPVEDCPTYVERFKENDVRPRQLCPLHRGSVRQKARRALESFWERLKEELGEIFR